MPFFSPAQNLSPTVTPLAGRSPLTEEAWPNCRESHFQTHFRTHVRMTGRSPLKRRSYSQVASSGCSRPSILDPAHPRPERPGSGPSPTRSVVGVVVEPEFSRVLGFPVGRGNVFPVVGVGVVMAGVLSFRQGGFKRWKGIFVYVLKFILTYFNNKLMWSPSQGFMSVCKFLFIKV